MEGAPYALGPWLVELIAADGGNDAVDAAFDDPPTTTEQMVDPRSYFSGQSAHDVAAPTVPSGGERIGQDDSLGALPLFLLLSERIDPLDALSAVDGWGGDAYVVYDRGGKTCMDLAVEGDSARDGEELLGAFQAWASAGPTGDAQVRSDSGLAVVSTCEPGAGTRSSGAALDALTLPAVRAQVMVAAGGTAGDVDEAFGAADCFVRAVPLGTLVQANESAEPSAEVMSAIDRAIADCRVD
jgi:hypothetical protein